MNETVEARIIYQERDKVEHPQLEVTLVRIPMPPYPGSGHRAYLLEDYRSGHYWDSQQGVTHSAIQVSSDAEAIRYAIGYFDREMARLQTTKEEGKATA